MNDALLVSNVLLWVGLLALLVAVLALSRQVGILYERVAPMGALITDAGPKLGEAAPRSMNEALEELGREAGRQFDPEMVSCFDQLIRTETEDLGMDLESNSGLEGFQSLIAALSEDRDRFILGEMRERTKLGVTRCREIQIFELAVVHRIDGLTPAQLINQIHR